MLPPFVVGEATTYNNARNVWEYDSGKKVSFPDVNTYKPLIFGSNNTIQSGNLRGFVLAGDTANFSNVDPNQTQYYDGVLVAGVSSKIYSNEEAKGTNPWDFVNRGSITASANFQFVNKGMLETANIYKENLTEEEKANCTKNAYKDSGNDESDRPAASCKFPWNQGSITAGRSFVFCGLNDGFIAGGDSNMVNGKNNGVLCLGRVIIDSEQTSIYKDFYGKEHVEDANNGKFIINPNTYGCGITIVGSTFDNRLTDPSKPYNQKTNPRIGEKSGYIQCSHSNKTPTQLKGYLQLTEDFHLLDKDGRELYNGKTLVSTINHLQERVAQLEAQLT